MIKVVVLIATYNGEKYIEDQIGSLLNQTVDFEILVRDDSSTDKTMDLLKMYEDKYKNITLINDKKESLSAKDNFSILLEYALSLNKYDYFFFCDQDDVWKENKIEIMLQRIKKLEENNKTPILIHSDLEVVDENLNLINKSFFNYQKLDYRRNSVSYLLVQNIFTGCTLLINKELAVKVSPIPKEVIMHDWWIGLVASLFGKIDCINNSTVLYRQHSNNSIGANGFNVYSIIKKVFNIFLLNTEKYSIQANQLLIKFEKELDKKDKYVLQEFVNIKDKNKFARILLLLKFKITKKGLIRNLGLFLKI